MKTTTRPRKLSRQHFAFARALAQGLDPSANWDRYLRLEGESTDLRKVRSTIAWLRSEFAAAARRQAKPGTARLILIDVDRLGTDRPLPTLAEFAAQRGMEDFSEADQAEAYAEAFGPATRNTARRAALIERQLQALRWLEDLVAEDPKPGDGVAAWLAPALAARIERAGMPTLFTLVDRINGIGSRWWTGVPGIGEAKAARIVEWLRENEASIGVRIGAHVDKRRTQLQPVELSAVVPAATGVVPLEKFLVPAELDGRAGRFRAAREQCLLEADNDYAAIQAWLASKRAGKEPGELSATQRAYRKEAERLLLWAILERHKPLSSLTVEDANAFMAFLQSPPTGWCGPRHRQRWSPLWRPLEGPLSATARLQALIIVRSLYTFLVSQNYVIGNPFAGVASPSAPARPLGSNRSLTFAQWDAIEESLQDYPPTPANRRRARALRWLYATGLRISELTAARCGDLAPLEFTAADGSRATGWLLSVIGKGDKLRQVPVPVRLVDELAGELADAVLDPDIRAESNHTMPILASFGEAQFRPWSNSGLYKAIKAQLGGLADQLREDEGAGALRLRRASPHWLRHTHGTHALNGREGHAPVPVQIVQNNLGHASIGTTSGYLTSEQESRLKAMEGFWGPAAQ